jgi:hypothetical protein
MNTFLSHKFQRISLQAALNECFSFFKGLYKFTEFENIQRKQPGENHLSSIRSCIDSLLVIKEVRL